MQKTILTIAIIAISFGFGFAFKSMIETRTAPLPSKRVTGIGGIFFKCKDPGKVKEWYKIDVLNPEGLAFDADGNVTITSDNLQRIYFFKNLPHN